MPIQNNVLLCQCMYLLQDIISVLKDVFYCIPHYRYIQCCIFTYILQIFISSLFLSLEQSLFQQFLFLFYCLLRRERYYFFFFFLYLCNMFRSPFLIPSLYIVVVNCYPTTHLFVVGNIPFVYMCVEFFFL